MKHTIEIYFEKDYSDGKKEQETKTFFLEINALGNLSLLGEFVKFAITKI
jgi:hypothetical protein